jgi:hypothetical protein
MRMLHVIPYHPPAFAYGGAHCAATDLTHALAEQKHTLHVLKIDTFSHTQLNNTLQDAIDSARITQASKLRNWLRRRLNLLSPRGLHRTAYRFTRQECIGIVHCHEVCTPNNRRMVPGVRARDLPIVVRTHGTLPPGIGRAFAKMAWNALFAGLVGCFNCVIELTATEPADARTTSPKRRSAHRTISSIVPDGVHLTDYAELPVNK